MTPPRVDDSELRDTGQTDVPAADNDQALHRRTGADVLTWLLIAVVAMGVVGYAAYRPGITTDLIFYAATVHQWDGLDAAAIHEATLADAREYLGPQAYRQITTENEYMRTVTADPEAMVQQIPFYSVKVLWPGLMIALRSIGIPLGAAQLLMSLTAYAALSLLVFAWLRRHHAPWPALVLGALVIISPPWANLARIEGPDALGTLLGIGGLFLILEHRRTNVGLSVLLLTMLARPNAVVMLVLVAICLALLQRSHPLRLSWMHTAAWSIAAVTVYTVLTAWSGNYGVGTLFYHAVVGYLPYPAAGSPHLPLLEIIRIYAFKAANISFTQIPFFAFLGIVAIRARVAAVHLVRTDAYAMVVLAMLGTIAIGYAIYPNEPERIQAMPFLACAMVLAVSVQASRLRREV